jgi:hypothetical protein
LGRREPVDYAHPGHYLTEMDGILDKLNLTPQCQEL